MTEWMPEMTIYEWLDYGRQRNFISEAVCDTHDGVPLSETERDQWEAGDEPCIHVVRIYENPEQKMEAEKDNP